DLIQIGISVVWGGPGTGSQPPVLGPWILSDNFTGAGVLPVALDYFKAEQKQPYIIRLEWATIQEFNNSEFIVEQSVDQKQWKSIGSIQSGGNGTERRVYQMMDKNPASGNNYYRLKQIDLDGKTNYSEIVRVTNNVLKNISIFPNPVNSSTRIYSKEPFKAGQVLQITNATGTRIKTINAAAGNSIQLDLSGYSAGLYLVQLIENGKVIENLQVVKQ
ncbi:MAG: T9SS type A sorting domain-containing protein, partial [Chitinophagaceae bacterium]|nr:T9SS type A sorting domain-containing protein [Chitinophagaceae bacterium]